MTLRPPFTAQFGAGAHPHFVRTGGPVQRRWLPGGKVGLRRQSFFKQFPRCRVLPSIDRSSRFGLDLQPFTEFTNATNRVVDGPPLAQVGLNVFQRLGLIEP